VPPRASTVCYVLGEYSSVGVRNFLRVAKGVY